MPLYRIADLTVAMEPQGRTRRLAQAYITDAATAPDVTIEVDRQKLKQRFPALTESYGEYLQSGEQFYMALAEHCGMMLHASSVAVDGKAYLFTGPCGTGKSTHTGLWLRYLGDRAHILNDDKPAVRLNEGRLYAYGTPWSGKHGRNSNECVPLQAICVLHQAKENTIQKMPQERAVAALMEQTTRKIPASAMEKLLDVLDAIVRADCMYEMGCNMDISAAELAYNTMR